MHFSVFLASSLRYTACGESPVDFRARIIGGNESQRGWWPWHVGLYIRSGGVNILYDMIIALVNVNDNNKSNDNYDDDGGCWEVT